ncbi:unnamed protein product, partial [marine sediment metagenome]
ISNPSLVNWRLTIGTKKANEIMKVRGEFGSRIHSLIQLTLGGQSVDMSNCDKETQDTMALFNTFLDEHDIKVKLLEQRLWFKLTEKY